MIAQSPHVAFLKPANFEKQKFVFWHPKFVFCTKKSYCSELTSQNAFWTFIHYYMYFSYSKWMQEGLPNWQPFASEWNIIKVLHNNYNYSTPLAREWNIIKVLHNKKNSVNLTFSGNGNVNKYIVTSIIWCQLHRLSSIWSTVHHWIPVPVAKPAHKIQSFLCWILPDSGQNDDL